MAYFPNGTSGMMYEEQFCWNCVHWSDEGGCPVMDAHNLYNYDQIGDDKAAKSLKTILDLLIPETKDGLGAEQCSMFRASADPDADRAEQRRLAEQPERYERAMRELWGLPRADELSDPFKRRAA
jgi:hypothetical protein